MWDERIHGFFFILETKCDREHWKQHQALESSYHSLRIVLNITIEKNAHTICCCDSVNHWKVAYILIKEVSHLANPAISLKII